ncbi:alpha/beta fold hydrolase [Magnetospira thiophila]
MVHSIPLLTSGPDDGPLLVLAHGAGAPMDSPFMVAFAEGLGGLGLRVVRFEFPYMALRRTGGSKRPPDRAPILLETWRQVIESLGGPGRLVIGGKSMGGRMASLLAADLEAEHKPVRGLVCLGYPFHGPGRPIGPNRLDHMLTLSTPALICQGERDSMGTRAEIESYGLPPAVQTHFLADGDHGFKPRKASGYTEMQNWQQAIEQVAAFMGGL